LPGEPKPSATYDIPLSDGLAYVVGWQENGEVLWVSCGAELGSGADKHVSRYLRTLAIQGPGKVEEQSMQAEAAKPGSTDYEAYRAVPEAVRKAFEALDK
jgi:hypothetical protein